MLKFRKIYHVFKIFFIKILCIDPKNLFVKVFQKCYDCYEKNCDVNLIPFEEGEILKQFLSKYRHGLVIGIYSILYILVFHYLESRPIHSYHIVHTVFDDLIPFCEFFIIPYLLWFPYMVLAVVYFIFFNKNKHDI